MGFRVHSIQSVKELGLVGQTFNACLKHSFWNDITLYLEYPCMLKVAYGTCMQSLSYLLIPFDGTY